MKNFVFMIYDYIGGCKHETTDILKLLRLVRDLTINYGDFEIKLKEISDIKEENKITKTRYVVFEIKK